MKYNFTLLKTSEDCNALLAIVTENKGKLEYRKTILQQKIKKASDNSEETDAMLKTVIDQMKEIENMITKLPDGGLKDELVALNAKLYFKKFMLNKRRANFGIITQFVTEVDIGCISKDIREIDTVIAGVNNRKASL